MNPREKLEADQFLQMFLNEYERAREIFGKFNSYHEGYAIIKEELDELWDEIKGEQKQENIYKEAIQIGAMVLRFLIDL